MQSLHHLFEFSNPDLSMIRIGRIGTLRHIVVLRIIAPIVLFLFQSGLVYCRIIKAWQQMNMCDSQPLKVFYTCFKLRMSLNMGRILRKRQVFSAVLHTGNRIPGKIPNMDLPYHCVCRILQQYSSILGPSFGIGPHPVNDHRTPPIDSGRSGIGIRCLHPLSCYRNRIRIICACPISLQTDTPESSVSAVHLNGRESPGTLLEITACCIQIQFHLLRCRTPQSPDRTFFMIFRS